MSEYRVTRTVHTKRSHCFIEAKNEEEAEHFAREVDAWHEHFNIDDKFEVELATYGWGNPEIIMLDEECC